MRQLPRDRAGFVEALEGFEDLRIFSYGSLMWNPECEVKDVRRVTVRGWHRDLCIYSYHYRGNRRFPGLVLGLAKGGNCQGLSMSL
jgi:cation transport protein ChaC